MKEISFTMYEEKEPTKYTINCNKENEILIVQEGPNSSKMLIDSACARKLMEALEYVIK